MDGLNEEVYLQDATFFLKEIHETHRFSGVNDLSRLKHGTAQCERVCVCRQTDESVPACKQPAICSEFVSREDFQGESKKRTRCLCCSAAL